MFSIHPLLVLSAIACLVAGIDNKEGLTYLKTQEGLDYLASNAAKHGVTTTASGLQYSVLNHGHTDGPRPTLYTSVMFSLAGRTIDGKEWGKPIPPGQSEPMRPTDMKAMMQEALMLMRPGDVFEFTMPPPPENTADPVLIYEIALERVAAEPTTVAWLADMILHRYPLPFLLSALILFRAVGWIFGLDTAAVGSMYRPEMHANHAKNQRVFFDVEIGGEPKGRIVFELFNHFVPITCENFRTLCAGSAKDKSWTYKGCAFHRIIENFMVQGGDFTAGNGSGGRSIYETPKFADEFGQGYITHQKHVLSMANSGKDTNGSQFFITTRECIHLDGKHVVFGMVVEGHDVVDAMEAVAGTPPSSEVRIANCGEIKTKST